MTSTASGRKEGASLPLALVIVIMLAIENAGAEHDYDYEQEHEWEKRGYGRRVALAGDIGFSNVARFV